ADWDGYVQQYYKNNQWNLSPMWKKMPALMLAKCAESLALRKAFPQELSGLYTADEMSQAHTEERTVDAGPSSPPPQVPPNTKFAGEPGDYVINFTKGFKGKKIKDLARGDLESLVNWCVDKNAM